MHKDYQNNQAVDFWFVQNFLCIKIFYALKITATPVQSHFDYKTIPLHLL